MNPDEAAIATELANAIRALNAVLEKARDAGLEVKVDSVTSREIGKRLDLRVYYAEVSKQAFVQRVG
jgi:DNA-directed RNA polymerase specialized sigma24 family protein